MVKFLKKIQQSIPISMLEAQSEAIKFVNEKEPESKEIRKKVIEILNNALNIETLDEDKKGIVQVTYLSTLIASMIKDSNTPKDIQKQMLDYIKTALGV